MDTSTNTTITVEATINASVEKVWKCWTDPSSITQWCQASEDWHAPSAENDLRTGGKFKTTMAAKDGSTSFDFEGIYSVVRPYSLIEYTLNDGRNVKIIFSPEGGGTRVTESFEAESIHPSEMQRAGWQAILNNFKKYTEANG